MQTYAHILSLTWAHDWAHTKNVKRIRINTPIYPENEKKAKRLVKKRIWGKIINKLLSEMEV